MASTNRYSAEVSLRLIVGDSSYGLSHLGPREFIVRGTCPTIEAGNAEIEVNVDGRNQTTQVFLPHGVPGPDVRVLYL
ncbi:hypothetical protein Pla123a_05710 [Posidoniimonas polymericola]|uniref:Uncharacterized protein n=1 Tax=Posidoniimonas polymericola TaxID=2528002 RepID=A0A5C5ZEH7_9BACT|nr:hypothetical protein [Posidoniimonas polymericola]TWT85764.1 hypothetical protein Pla123a_05710 [Posidoniimonas polymericola]